MKYNIKRENNHSIATITDENSTTVTSFITIDIHEKSSVTNQALGLLYPDALLSGTKKLTRQEFLNEINLLGASINISVTNNKVSIILKSTNETFSKLLKIVEDMLANPAFSPSEIKRIKTTTINELYAEKENSRIIATERLINSFYDKNDRKYTYEIEEIVKEIPKITPKQLKLLHTKVMSQFWTCSIAGNTSHVTAINKLINKLKKNFSPKSFNPIHKQKLPNPKLILKQISSRQNIDFSIGAPVPITLHHPDYIPLTFAIAVLGKWGGFTGRLMSTVREIEGLTYGIYSLAEGFSGTEQGHWRIMTFFSPDKALQGIKSTYREISNLYANGITKDELDRFKIILNTQQTLLQDSIVGLLKNLHTYHYHQFTVEEIKERKARITSLELDEINQVIKKYLNPNNLTISAAGPIKTVQKDLQSFIKK